MSPRSCIYEGTVFHRRWFPIRHEFRYSLFMMYLDLEELPQLFEGRWLWSSRRRALARFRREDHLGDPRRPLDEAVRDLVEERTSRRPGGRIRLLTHLAYFGYVFNPISVYYCFDSAEQKLEAAVLEVHNTPWGEQHVYVLDGAENQSSAPALKLELDKAFHVSPFLGMDLRYRFRVAVPGSVVSFQMDCLNAERRQLEASLVMKRREITPRALSRVLWRYPLMTGKVVAAIYWQAIRLWWKKAPFHPHPKVSASHSGTPQ